MSKSSKSNKILIIAGEISGDLHAAPVVSQLKELDPSLSFFGAGGDLMENEGVELLARVEDMAVMGFSGIPKILPRLFKLKKEIIARIKKDNVRLAILVDYPGFNLQLAKSLKKLPNPPKILEYIAPQVWAWREGRVKTIRRVVDQLAVVFPFEEDYFTRFQIPVKYVGHPLLDELDWKSEELRRPADRPLLALLPGSRLSVVKKHLLTMVKAGELIRQSIPNLEIGIGKSSNIPESTFHNILENKSYIKLCNNSRKLLLQATASVVCSGTATLEAALLNCPQVVIYRTSYLNYNLIKRYIKLQNVGMVNIVSGKKIVPELIQADFTPENIRRHVSPLLQKTYERKSIVDNYKLVNRILGDGGAASNVAELASEMLK